MPPPAILKRILEAVDESACASCKRRICEKKVVRIEKTKEINKAPTNAAVDCMSAPRNRTKKSSVRVKRKGDIWWLPLPCSMEAPARDEGLPVRVGLGWWVDVLLWRMPGLCIEVFLLGMSGVWDIVGEWVIPEVWDIMVLRLGRWCERRKMMVQGFEMAKRT